MLFAEPTKRGIGLTLYGDYSDLCSLHETVHVLSGNGDSGFNDQQEHVLSVAYELRKAYEEQRVVKLFMVVGQNTSALIFLGRRYFSTHPICGSVLASCQQARSIKQIFTVLSTVLRAHFSATITRSALRF